MTELREPLDAPNGQQNPNISIDAPSVDASAAAPVSRRERRESHDDIVPAVPRPTTAVTRSATSLIAAPRASAPIARATMQTAPPRFTKPTKRNVAGGVVMTFAVGLIATMALPAYAFGSGTAGFDSNNSADLGGAAQSITVDDTAAALAVSRDAYTAPTSAELQAARDAAAAAVAATEASTAAASAASAASAAAPTAGTFAVNPPSGAYSGQAVVDYAEQFVGVVPYSAGATPEAGFGCDGLTQYVFGQFGIYLPRIVGNQAAMGIRVSPEDAQPGDLVVWPMYHVGIYDGAGGVIDSPDWGRFVEHRALWGSYYFVRIV
ncbi:C40 family peptidase [Agreia sp.]|uniref:C40 family peptidase n=1 Tax=Agreia sp. TaxID=1872416 RepID=UPI0035BBB3F8